MPAVVAAATTTTVTINQPNYIASAETNNSQNNITAVVTLPQAQVTRCFECGQVFPNAAMLQVFNYFRFDSKFLKVTHIALYQG